MLGAEAEIVEVGEVRLGYISRRVLGQGRGVGVEVGGEGQIRVYPAQAPLPALGTPTPA